jgi:predicted metal-dependent phosphoesterase TrpH
MNSLIVDFHSHTFASKDSLTSPEKLIVYSRRHKLDRVVVTDHNTISGARAAHEIDPGLIIIGEEIMTTQGEILAVYVKDEIPAGLNPEETIRRLRGQGAFISVSHPFDAWRSGAWKLEDLLAIIPLIDAIEVFNARCMMPDANQKAVEFACQHHLAGTAGSDAHSGFELGRGVVHLPQFEDADGLRSIIRKGEVRGKHSPLWVHFTSRYASLRKRMGYNSTGRWRNWQTLRT